MRRGWGKLFALLLSAAFLPDVYVPGSGSVCAQGVPFTVGETLHYRLYYGAFPAGKQTMRIEGKTVYGGRAAYKIAMQIESSAGLSVFYDYKEQDLLFLDEKEIRPLYVQKEIKERGESSVVEVTFSADQKTITRKIVKGDCLRLETYASASACQEDLSLYYFLRTRPWLRGDKDFVFLGKHGIKTFEFSVKEGGEISTLLGKFKTDRVENREQDYVLWFSRDEQALPLLIKKGKFTSKLVRVEIK